MLIKYIYFFVSCIMIVIYLLFYDCMYVLYTPVNRLVPDVWCFINVSNNNNNY